MLTQVLWYSQIGNFFLTMSEVSKDLLKKLLISIICCQIQLTSVSTFKNLLKASLKHVLSLCSKHRYHSKSLKAATIFVALSVMYRTPSIWISACELIDWILANMLSECVWCWKVKEFNRSMTNWKVFSDKNYCNIQIRTVSIFVWPDVSADWKLNFLSYFERS